MGGKELKKKTQNLRKKTQNQKKKKRRNNKRRRGITISIPKLAKPRLI